MLKSKKHVFWEALLVTILIFSIGILVGVGFEKNRTNIIERYYEQSEVSLVDVMVLQKLSDLENYDCHSLINANIEFADKIYSEAIVLENYEEANKLTDDLVMSHKKYDLLRTFVWANSLKIFEKCSKDFTPIVYLYEYNTEDLNKKAEQKVWSRILYDLKQEEQDKIILLPIAADNNLSSVDALISQFNIEKFPCVIVGNEKVFYNLTSTEEIKAYINNYDPESVIKLN
jgi:hypothetical protein